DGRDSKIAPATIIEENGAYIGVVGATTQLLDAISSPTGTTVIGGPFATDDLVQLAAILQPVIDDLIAGDAGAGRPGVNKVILTSHLQQLSLETTLAGLLHGVDVIIAGGSDTILADGTDRLRTGDVAVDTYPRLTTDADGNPVAIMSTDGEYSYVGRLVVEFDAAGHIIPSSIDANVSGAFATDDQGVLDVTGEADIASAIAASDKATDVAKITAAVQDVVIATDSNVFGETDVFLDGVRTSVRTEETNLGDLSADANLAVAQSVDATVMVSIKNGGGIRAPIGEVDMAGNEVPTAANPLSGKEAGEISQLDIENSLRFNNELSLITLTPEQLLQVLEHAVAAVAPGATPGQFAQVGGISFSYDPTAPSGDRVMSAALVDDLGNKLAIVENGDVLPGAPAAIRVVTLNFLADGGDNYPFDDFVAADPVFADRVDLPSIDP
ncbi:MAG: 5'-nucleotidase C-terminal domain-containing protein, partial [Rhodobiaceae bacterium]|nr:5'-nucleotidase C-terminal domain-containing protein [Rhodobiaceae bacterium]